MARTITRKLKLQRVANISQLPKPPKNQLVPYGNVYAFRYFACRRFKSFAADSTNSVTISEVKMVNYEMVLLIRKLARVS